MISHCELLEFPTPFPVQNSRVLLLEPAGSCATELARQLLEGTYDKPFILDCGTLRYLHFDFDKVQSLMRCDDPDTLCLRYTRKMMTFLLFNPQPRRILMLGLGGGSLAKFCYRHLPSATITAIEIDPHVMALREAFRVPADDERFRVLQGDGTRYVALRGPREDVILVDAYDRHGAACGLGSVQFYRSARRRLTLGGVLVMNIHGDACERATQFARARSAFGKRVIALPVREDGNLIVLAFRTDAAARNWRHRERLADALRKRFGLNFPRYVRKMQGDRPTACARQRNDAQVAELEPSRYARRRGPLSRKLRLSHSWMRYVNYLRPGRSSSRRSQLHCLQRTRGSRSTAWLCRCARAAR